MKGITFGSFHSYRDLGLLLASKEIGSPPVKENKIDIEGADGSLDLTEFFGEAKFDNVRHKFDFALSVPPQSYPSIFSQIKNALHGKKMRIILDDDPTFYYVGRLHVSSFTNDRGAGYLSIDADCDPYKYKISKTVVSRTISGTETITLTNGRKRAVPLVTIQAEASIRIVYGSSNIWDLGSGSYTLPELELVEGGNAVTVTGTGTISFEWQEANL